MPSTLTAASMLLASVAPALAASSSSGCGIQHTPGWSNDTKTLQIQSSNNTRYYAVNIPANYNANPHKKWPVIFDYHGRTDTPWDQYQNSQYFDFSAGQDYLVIYPAGLNFSWTGPSYAVPGANDLQFTSDLLAHVQTQYCIDSERVYASGKSNGGGFVDTLACADEGDAFAAFAMASAALYTDNSLNSCPKSRPIMESHGDLDQVIPYAGGTGRGGTLPDINVWVSWWGERNCGAHAEAKNTTNLGGYNTTSYSCHGYENVVFHYQIFKLGHCWPCTSLTNFDSETMGANGSCLDPVLGYTPDVLNFFGAWDHTNSMKFQSIAQAANSTSSTASPTATASPTSTSHASTATSGVATSTHASSVADRLSSRTSLSWYCWYYLVVLGAACAI